MTRFKVDDVNDKWQGKGAGGIDGAGCNLNGGEGCAQDPQFFLD